MLNYQQLSANLCRTPPRTVRSPVKPVGVQAVYSCFGAAGAWGTVCVYDQFIDPAICRPVWIMMAAAFPGFFPKHDQIQLPSSTLPQACEVPCCRDGSFPISCFLWPPKDKKQKNQNKGNTKETYPRQKEGGFLGRAGPILLSLRKVLHPHSAAIVTNRPIWVSYGTGAPPASPFPPEKAPLSKGPGGRRPFPLLSTAP